MASSSDSEDDSFMAVDQEEPAPEGTMEQDENAHPGLGAEEPRHNRSMSELPEEVLEYILSFLSPYQEHKTAALVCKQWYRLIKGTVQRKRSLISGFVGRFIFRFPIFSLKCFMVIQFNMGHLTCFLLLLEYFIPFVVLEEDFTCRLSVQAEACVLLCLGVAHQCYHGFMKAVQEGNIQWESRTYPYPGTPITQRFSHSEYLLRAPVSPCQCSCFQKLFWMCVFSPAF